MRRPLSTLEKLFGAVLLGVGTLFQAKRHHDDHWSTSPKVELLSEAADDTSGDPPSPR